MFKCKVFNSNRVYQFTEIIRIITFHNFWPVLFYFFETVYQSCNFFRCGVFLCECSLFNFDVLAHVIHVEIQLTVFPDVGLHMSVCVKIKSSGNFAAVFFDVVKVKPFHFGFHTFPVQWISLRSFGITFQFIIKLSFSTTSI